MFSIFKKSVTINEAAESIFKLMRTDFKPEWKSKLETISSLDTVRAEDELLFLDFFAVYFSLKFTRSSSWKTNGQLVFEKVFHLLSNWIANFWTQKNVGTLEDVITIIDSRLQTYSSVINEDNNLDNEEFIHQIGLKYAIYAFTDDSMIGADGKPLEGHFSDFLDKISQDHKGIAIAVGGEVFNNRMQVLYNWFNTRKVVTETDNRK